MLSTPNLNNLNPSSTDNRPYYDLPPRPQPAPQPSARPGNMGGREAVQSLPQDPAGSPKRSGGGREASPKRSGGGAPRGNTNALKHGFYSPRFNKVSAQPPAGFDFRGLEQEINLLRQGLQRVCDFYAQIETLQDAAVFMGLLCTTSSTINRLIRTQAFLNFEQHDFRSALSEAVGIAIDQIRADPSPYPADYVPEVVDGWAGGQEDMGFSQEDPAGDEGFPDLPGPDEYYPIDQDFTSFQESDFAAVAPQPSSTHTAEQEPDPLTLQFPDPAPLTTDACQLTTPQPSPDPAQPTTDNCQLTTLPAPDHQPPTTIPIVSGCSALEQPTPASRSCPRRLPPVQLHADLAYSTMDPSCDVKRKS